MVRVLTKTSLWHFRLLARARWVGEWPDGRWWTKVRLRMISQSRSPHSQTLTSLVPLACYHQTSCAFCFNTCNTTRLDQILTSLFWFISSDSSSVFFQQTSSLTRRNWWFFFTLLPDIININFNFLLLLNIFSRKCFHSRRLTLTWLIWEIMRSKIVWEAKHFLNNPSIFSMKLLKLLILPAELCQVLGFLCSVFWF